MNITVFLRIVPPSCGTGWLEGAQLRIFLLLWGRLEQGRVECFLRPDYLSSDTPRLGSGKIVSLMGRPCEKEQNALVYFKMAISLYVCMKHEGISLLSSL